MPPSSSGTATRDAASVKTFFLHAISRPMNAAIEITMNTHGWSLRKLNAAPVFPQCTIENQPGITSTSSGRSFVFSMTSGKSA